ncbi:MAG: pantetheine-phosphate adenylyltransferase [bacterium]|nr:pantetheine-phosphate adenylyltransferase [bacterium]
MKAFYAGSFDPFTNGHLYVLRQAAQIFDQVILGIGQNPNKKRNFSAGKMKELIEKVLKQEGLNNVSVVVYDGLTVKAAENVQAHFLIRGLRNGVDYDYEENLALINQDISGLETIYFRAGDTAHVSASGVVQLWRGGVDVKKFVPEIVYRAILAPSLD